MLKLLSKLTGIDKQVEWYQGRCVTVFSRSSLGYHRIYVDQHMKAVLFSPRMERQIHLFRGTYIRPELFEIYNSDIEVEETMQITSSDGFDWKLKPKRTLYRGGYVSGFATGDVIKSHTISFELSEEWIANALKAVMQNIASGIEDPFEGLD